MKLIREQSDPPVPFILCRAGFEPRRPRKAPIDSPADTLLTYAFADTGRSKDDTPSIGCFDRPFLIHIIRDVFVISPIVTVPEFSLKAALVTYMDITNGEDEAQVVAENLTDNARSIMRN